jgi:hypothetical protein
MQKVEHAKSAEQDNKEEAAMKWYYSGVDAAWM